MELKDITSPNDIKGLDIAGLKTLASEMRQALLAKLSAKGGHVGPNLGVVELTLALHYVFDTPVDKIVFDVSHQCYPHKMLTGRVRAYVDPEHYGDVTGFTNPSESVHDLFTIGHTSTAVSLASGLAKARDMRGDNENVVAVVGDGALSGGEAFEGLDYAATLGSNFIVVVNDNDMSIAENHGGLYGNLKLLRDSGGESPLNYFKALGFEYRFVADGNDLQSLIDTLKSVRGINHPVVVHVVTKKGMGYEEAEEHKEAFHFSAPFNLADGKVIAQPKETYGDVSAKLILQRMSTDPELIAITAGTPGIIGFDPMRRKQAGNQFVDVGIAEQQAVSLAAGISKGGGTPWLGLVSSFMQRAYDQLSQDVGINRTPVAISVFAGSLYAMRDATHLGWFDIPLLTSIPGFVYLAPTCKQEYEAMLTWALTQKEYPVAVKVPGGRMVDNLDMEFDSDYSDLNIFKVTQNGSDVAVIGAGAFYQLGLEVAKQLSANGITPTVINPRYLSGLDEALLQSLEANHRLVITLEDGALNGGFGEKIAAYYGTSDMEVRSYGLGNEFADNYDYAMMTDIYRLRPEQIAEDALVLLCK